MKKVIAVLAAVVVAMAVLAVSAPVFTPVFADETVTTGEAPVGDGGETEYVRLTGEGFDPYAMFAFSDKGANTEIDPDTVTWAAIRYRTAARYNENGVEYIMQMYVSPAAEPFIPAHYAFSGEWDTLIVDMTSVAARYERETIWDSGNYTSTSEIRIDPLEPDRDAENFDDSTGRGIATEGDYVDIAWIAFFKTEDDVKNFAGPDRTKPTPEPTPTPDISTIAPFGTIIFDSDDYDDFWTGANLIDDVSFNEEDKCYDISIPEGGDPFITMAFGSYISMEEMDEVELDTYKIMQIKMKIDPKIGLQGNIYYSTDEAPGAYAEAQNVSYRYANTEDWQVVNVDFTRQRNWTSILDACRLDAFPSTSADTVVKVAYITFFKTLAEAQAFADMGSQFPATPEPTATPTPTPTPDVTATPEPTDAPTEKPTEAPTPEPKKTGCGNVIGGTFAVIALAACALVIRKKH